MMDMNNERFERIRLNPAIMGGKPCIRGTRVTVGRIVSQIGVGETIEELLVDYPYIEREDILQALQYAAWLSGEIEKGALITIDTHKVRIHLLPLN
jgi:uncharacterized protein (DUF433 family)